ncbi:MAG: hypothetical protein ABSF67_01385 [Roseiarcus sp.]|jgi:hypothetical protein
MNSNASKKDHRFFIDINAPGTARGKSLTSQAIRDHFRADGIEPIVVRFESAAAAGTRPSGEVFIASEKLLDAEPNRGGPVGTLNPVEEAIAACGSKGTPVILDWAGGQSALRADFYAASGFDSFVAEQSFVGFSLVVTTNQAASMIQAAEALDLTAKVAPLLRRVLVLNRRDGGFDGFPPGGAEAKAYADALMPQAAKCAARLTLPVIARYGWEPFAAAGLGFIEVLNRPVGELADITGLSYIVAAACRHSVAAWCAEVEPQLERLFPLQ